MYYQLKTEHRNWVCPSCCGCGVKLAITTRIIDADLLRIFLIQNPDANLTEAEKRGGIVSTQAVEFLGKGMCAQHASQYTTPDELYQDLKHLHGFAFKPLTCGCSLAYYKDDRIPEGERASVAVNDPVYTIKCPEHAEIEDHGDHFDIVTTENSSLGLMMSAVESALDENQKAEAAPYFQDFSLIPIEWEQENKELEGRASEKKTARKLAINLPGVSLSAQDKDRIHQEVQSKFTSKAHLMRIK